MPLDAADSTLIATTSPDVRYRPVMAWLVLALLGIFMLVNFADRTILALAAQPLMAELHLSAAEFGFISSAFYFLYSVSAVGVGFLATRTVSLKWLLFIMSLLWAATQLPVFLFAGAGVLLGTRIVLGAAEGPATAVANSTAYSWFPAQRRGLPTSVLTSGPSLAKLIAAPLLTVLIVDAGWRWAFLALAAASAVWCLIWLVLGGEGPFAEPRAPVLTAAAAAVDRAERRASYRRVVLSRTFLLLLLAGYPLYALVSVIFSWLPSYLQVGLNFSPLTSGFLFGLPSVVVLAFMLIAGWVTDRLLAAGVSSRVARGLVPTLSLVLGGLLLAMLPLAGTERYLAYALLVGGYSLTVLALPIIYATIGTAAAPGQRTSVLSLFIGLQSTSGIVAPWATGLLIDAADTPSQGYRVAFVVLGLLIFAGGAIAAVVVDPGRDTAVAGV